MGGEEIEKTTVLVVDDEPGMRRSIERFLSAAGHKVLTAESADQALGTLFLGGIDVVVTDIIMPRISGIDLLKVIHDSYPEVRVIIITGEPGNDTANEASQSGAFIYLEKPIEKATICQAVKDAVSTKNSL